MSAWLMGVVAVIYAATAISLWGEGRPGLAAAWLFYGLANVGFIYDLMRG